MKSFTIILMTAAFIVVLAVLSVAALAFYFSTFKSDDCKCLFILFRIHTFLFSYIRFEFILFHTIELADFHICNTY